MMLCSVDKLDVGYLQNHNIMGPFQAKNSPRPLPTIQNLLQFVSSQVCIFLIIVYIFSYDGFILFYSLIF